MDLLFTFSSDSDSDSDLEMLCQLSDWDVVTSSSDDECEDRIGVSTSRLSYCLSHKSYSRFNYMQNLNDSEFTYRFRLNKAAVEFLLKEIMPYVKVTSKRNNGVAPLHQLLLTLRFYALGTMLHSVSDYVGVSKSSANRIVQNVSVAIAQLYHKHVFVHQDSASSFYKIAHFPRVLGAIACTHIHIQTPNHSASKELRHSKEFYSLKVQVVCDSDLKFMNVVARWPGAASNDTIFDYSDLRAQFEKGDYGNRWLVGDSAYTNRPYLLTPLAAPATRGGLTYNAAHDSTRGCITRALGMWKRRFPAVGRRLRLALDTVQAVVVATSVLHNVCVSRGVAPVAPEVEPLADDADDATGPPHSEYQDFNERTKLINDFFSH